MGTISLSGMTFPDTATSGWWFSGLIGWGSVTDAKGGLSDRPIAHGSFDPGVAWRESVSASFVVHFGAESGVDALVGLRELRGLAAATSLVEMVVDIGDGPFSRMVRVHSIEVPDTHGRSAVTATVYVQAPDPLAYGPTVTASTGVPTAGVGVADPITDPFSEGAPGNLGRVTFTNPGTAPTSVTVVVAGGLSEGVEIRVVETGEILRLERLIPDGSVVTFRSRTGRAVIDGQSDVTGFLTVDAWPQVPAGATRTFQFTPLGAQSGTPSMSVSAAPAYF